MEEVSQALDKLNPVQRGAVCAPAGHCLVLAGAGSGKTQVLVQRFIWLHQTQAVPLHGIWAATFSNKAAAQMRWRIQAQLPDADLRLWIGTFHGLAHRLLCQHWQAAGLVKNFQIIDTDNQLRLLRHISRALAVDIEIATPQWLHGILSWIGTQKEHGRRPQHIQPCLQNPEFELRRTIYLHYQQQCEQTGLVDFSELLLRAHELLRDNPTLLAQYRRRFQHLLVDEFQDTNTLQYAFIRLLAGESAQVFVVGDDDQAIYSWRGAKVENVRHFLNDFPDVHLLRLEQNYRSTATILQAANAVIAHNSGRIGKQLWTEREKGHLITLFMARDHIDETHYLLKRVRQWVAAGGRYDDIAVLYRNNAQSRSFEETLLSEAIPHCIRGSLRFFERAEVRDTVAWLRLLVNPDDDLAFERVVNRPARGIGERTLQLLRQQARQYNCSLWELSQQLTANHQKHSLPSRALNALSAFIALVTQLKNKISGLTVAQQVTNVIHHSNLYQYWLKQSRSVLEWEARRDNFQELIAVAAHFDQQPINNENSLPAFLAHIALVLAAGEEQTTTENSVQLMTLHAAKGLEFPLVFLVGMEEGIFPSPRALESADGLEEERRLAYVGMTRAREQLICSYARSRYLYGQRQENPPSRFLSEIPSELCAPSPLLSSPLSHYPIAIAAKVQHHVYGEGVVMGYQGQGDYTQIQIQFKESGCKWLVLAYADLKILPA